MAYITLAQVRSEGLKAADFPDGKVNAAIARSCALLDRLTGQWFESRAVTATLDGNGTDTLFLPVPVISVTSLYVNGDFTNALDSESYAVYNGRQEPSDHRSNPMIKLVKSTDIFAPFEDPQTPVFSAGRQNQRIVGAFGYLEADDTTPLPIQRAAMILTIRDLTNPLFVGEGSTTPENEASSGVSGPKQKETTDRHSITYAAPSYRAQRTGTLALTGSAEVEEIIATYRRPLAIEASSDVLWLHAS